MAQGGQSKLDSSSAVDTIVYMQTTKVTKWGNSIALRLPSSLVHSAGLLDGSSVTLMREGDRIVIQKVNKKNPTLASLIARITPDNQHTDAWLDIEPVGNEIW